MARTRGTTVKPYSAPPETERKLQELQEAFLADRDNTKVRDEFFLLLKTYTRSLTLKDIKRKSIFISPERVDEICTDAVIALWSQYSKEGWKVSASFAGVLTYKIWGVMYSNTQDELTLSLNNTFTDDSDSKEVIDIIGPDCVAPWQQLTGNLPKDDPADTVVNSVELVYSEIEEIIKEAYDILPYKSFIRFVLWLVLQIRKPRTRNVQQLFTEMYLTSKEEEAFNLLLLEIRNRILDETD